MDGAILSRSTRRLWLVVDLAVVVVVHLIALELRFQGKVSSTFWDGFPRALPWVVATYFGAELVAGAYSAANPILRAVAGAILAGGVVVILGDIWIGPPLPRSVAIFGAVGCAIGFVGVEAGDARPVENLNADSDDGSSMRGRLPVAHSGRGLS